MDICMGILQSDQQGAFWYLTVTKIKLLGLSVKGWLDAAFLHVHISLNSLFYRGDLKHNNLETLIANI